MRSAMVVSIVGLLAMSIALIYGFTVGDFMQDGGEILSNPWGIVSMVDLYVGFVLFSVWIIYREEKLLVSIVWVILMMVLGFFTGSLYVLVTLIKSKGNKEQFFLGKMRERNEG